MNSRNGTDQKQEQKSSFEKERVRKPKEEWTRQNIPIRSEVKSKKVYMSEPINETCWAYMKLLREQSSSRRIYEEDPYAEVYRFRDNMWAIFTESLDGMGDSWMYLIEGPEKAMLIDNGFGVGNVRALCEAIVPGKEIIPVVTHGHFDHAYGSVWFDRVYCHEYEAPSLRSQDEHIWDYLFQDDGLPIWTEFDRADIPKFDGYEVIGVPDGYTWDLGDGYEIELIYLGGHTAGHCGFLDKKGRNFYCGDDFISMRVGIFGPHPGDLYGEHATVSEFRNNVYRLNRRIDEIDHLFPGHFVTDLEYSVIPSMLEALDEILADPAGAADHVRESARGNRYDKYVAGLGQIAYSDRSIGDIPPICDSLPGKE